MFIRAGLGLGVGVDKFRHIWTMLSIDWPVWMDQTDWVERSDIFSGCVWGGAGLRVDVGGFGQV